jgi:hypothetical protein
MEKLFANKVALLTGGARSPMWVVTAAVTP